MFIYNYHTHTSRCGHASGSDEEYVLAAIKAGYKVLGFSDHAPYQNFYRPRSHMHWEELDDYIRSVNTLKEKYKDQITIRLGLETEYYPEVHAEREELAKRLDYMLLGQHFSALSLDSVNYFKENSDEEILEYAQAVCDALDSGIFTYLCHPDVFMNHQTVFSESCQKAAHMIGRKCEETGTPAEINIRGVMKGLKHFPDGEQYWYPNKAFWRIMSQYDIKTVVGIDAHDPNDLLQTGMVTEGLEHLKDLDLHFIEDPFID
ncbi:MAG: histidinol-phosphatase [Erysipelotrichaceae bacterium]|jgi:histidinol-phosphatase (PHP family)|nr:histidinol-phosphatase [Erysipelotrichaceae bacterium]